MAERLVEVKNTEVPEVGYTRDRFQCVKSCKGALPIVLYHQAWTRETPRGGGALRGGKTTVVTIQNYFKYISGEFNIFFCRYIWRARGRRGWEGT